MEPNPSSLLNAELLATCNALGYLEKGIYHKDPECLESLKDLIRFLRHDDEAHEIRRQLGAISIIETDLIPIIKEYSQENEIFDVTLRLLVNLTNPALLLYKEELPEEKISRNYYLECVAYLQKCKKTFADSRVWTVFSKKLQTLLEQDWEHKEEDDNIVIERILILLRNVLHIPSNPEEEKRTDDDVSIHDQIIWALHASGMSDLILFISANENQECFSFHIMEIIFHILREQEPEQLASAGQSRPQAEKERDIQALTEILARERAQKMAAIAPSRHPRFGGTYCVKNIKSVSENDVICHKPLKSIESLNFDDNKKVRKIPKNRLPIEDCGISRRSTLSIRLYLKDFCVDFLDNAYNHFMAVVKDHLTKRKAQDHDESYYLWALCFFMKFSRLHRLDISRISETVSKQCFHYIHTQIENYIEMMMTDKKAVKCWSKRAHLALRAYQALITTLAAMMASKDKKISESGRIIAGTIFYLMEYRDLLLHLLNVFDPIKYPKSYLKDLIETTHTFLKILEQFCGQHKHMIVENRKKKRAKAKKAEKTAEKQKSLDEIWDALADDVSAVLKGSEEIPKDVLPFDAASELDFEDQKKEALGKIQDALREKRAGEAVALFRASRELWPDGEVFGSVNEKPEVEYLLLREIYFAELPRAAAAATDTRSKDGDSGNEDEGEEEEDELSHVHISEQEFSFSDFIKRFACPKVVAAYGLLLSSYQKNDPQSNHCLLKLMHRIAWDQKMYGLFFQSSVFRTFQKIMSDPALGHSPVLKELSRFATFIIRKFFETAEKNKKVFVEMLFWKNSKEIYEIQEGYGTLEKSKPGKVLWTEEQDEELKLLFDQFKEDPQNDMDVIDLIVANIIDKSKTRRQVIRQLKSLSVITDIKQYQRKTVSLNSSSKQWRDEEVDNLSSLFYKHRASMDILSRLMEGLLMKRSKRSISDKLLELGLVQDRKELRKKRVRKGQDCGNASGDDRSPGVNSDVASDCSSESDDDDIPTRKSSGSNRKCSSQSSRALNVSAVKGAVESVVADGLQPAIEWLRESLEGAAEDRETDDDWESAPLVPILEDQANAMTNKNFEKLMRCVGVVPPATEQESFWRIPGSLSPDQLKERSEIIGKILRGELGDIDELSWNSETPGDNSETQTNSVQENDVPKKAQKKNKRPVLFPEDEDETGAVQSILNPSASTSISQSKKPKAKRRISRFPNDENSSQSLNGNPSSDIDGDNPLVDQIYSSTKRRLSKPKPEKRDSQSRRIVMSDSDEDTLSNVKGVSSQDRRAKWSASKNVETKRNRMMAVLAPDSDDDAPLFSQLKSGIDVSIPTVSKKPSRIAVMPDSDDDVSSDVGSLAVDGLTELGIKPRRVMSDSDDDTPLSANRPSEVTSRNVEGTHKKRTEVISDSDEDPVTSGLAKKNINTVIDSDSDDDVPFSVSRKSEISLDISNKRDFVLISDSDDDTPLSFQKEMTSRDVNGSSTSKLSSLKKRSISILDNSDDSNFSSKPRESFDARDASSDVCGDVCAARDVGKHVITAGDVDSDAGRKPEMLDKDLKWITLPTEDTGRNEVEKRPLSIRKRKFLGGDLVEDSVTYSEVDPVLPEQKMEARSSKVNNSILGTIDSDDDNEERPFTKRVKVCVIESDDE